MTKPIKYSVAVIIKDQAHPRRFLIVKRPDDDPDHGGKWGLPAITMETGELLEQAAERVCREKLNCSAVPTRFIGAMFQKRNSYDIFLMDIEMVLIGNYPPDCMQATTTHTKYVAQRWSTRPLDLLPSARDGSCCSSIFLTDRGLMDTAEWITSLEGSKSVA